MEILLLLIIIILLLVFNSKRSKMLEESERRLANIENYLKKINLTQTQKTESSNPPSSVVETSIENIPNNIQETITKDEIEIEEILDLDEQAQEIYFEEEAEELTIEQENIKQPERPIQQPITPKESWYTTFRKNNPDIEKFIGENIISKIGVAILVIGIAFFVKFAIDKDWINEIARVGIGILCGVTILGFAHRLHTKFKAFSSVLVGGGIAIFYFTIGIAFHQYHLFGQTSAFIIMLLITSFSVFISIVYDRIELAALSIIGGFATPFMVSTGQGNYQILFTYILILDIGMLVLAYLRKWNLINILAYCFTMLLYFGWLESKVIGLTVAPYKGAFIFASSFYLIFLLMNIINNIKERKTFSTVDLSILVSNTFLFFTAGMQILGYYHPELKGIFCILLAGFNLVCSFLLFKKFNADSKLVYLMIGLTLTFVTLTAPIQLEGNYITLFWALESILLIWLSQKSNIIVFRFASIIITCLMCFSLFMDWDKTYSFHHVSIIFNKAFMSGFASSLSLLGIILLLRNETEKLYYLKIPFNPINYSKILKIAFVIFIYLTGFLELIHQVNVYFNNFFTRAIIVQLYHFLFLVTLNCVVSKLQNKAIQISMYVLNLVSLFIFILIFSWLPLTELKTAFYAHEEHSNAGFILHYFTLVAFITILYLMYKSFHAKNTYIKNNKALNTILLSIAILYLSSIELVLLGLKINLPDNLQDNDFSFVYNAIKTNIIKIGLPILWGILSFLFLIIGVKKHNKPFRVISLLLIAITLLKLFIYDIRNASEGGKILAFIILGIVLLIISFTYQKIKALLLEDQGTISINNSDETDNKS